MLFSRWHNGELAISNEMGKSSSISKEQDEGKLVFIQYSHLSRHLIAVIQSDPKKLLYGESIIDSRLCGEEMSM